MIKFNAWEERTKTMHKDVLAGSFGCYIKLGPGGRLEKLDIVKPLALICEDEGIEIYYGDVVLMHFPEFEGTEEEYIIQAMDEAVDNPVDYYGMLDYETNAKVIGNIYQNPEMKKYLKDLPLEEIQKDVKKYK